MCNGYYYDWWKYISKGYHVNCFSEALDLILVSTILTAKQRQRNFDVDISGWNKADSCASNYAKICSSKHHCFYMRHYTNNDFFDNTILFEMYKFVFIHMNFRKPFRKVTWLDTGLLQYKGTFPIINIPIIKIIIRRSSGKGSALVSNRQQTITWKKNIKLPENIG